MRTSHGVEIIEGLSPTAFVIRCVYCEGYGTLGPNVAFPRCPLCMGDTEVGVIVDGSAPLRACIRCHNTGHLGPPARYTAFPPCDTCQGLGCRPHAGTLKAMSASQLRLSIRPVPPGQIADHGEADGPRFATIKEVEKSMATIEIFISHSSSDEELAKRLITLIQSALLIPSELIRCTSVDGFRLPAGTSTDEALRREIHESRAFIAIITPSSITSIYVLFELGARWGAQKPLIPLLGNGASATVLRGPLASLNALSCDNPAQLHQFVDDLAALLKRKAEPAAAYSKCVDEVARTSKADTMAHRLPRGSQPFCPDPREYSK